MRDAGRIALFLIVVLGTWTLMHVYVVWRVSSVPSISAHVSRWILVAAAAFLWLAYPLSRILDRGGVDFVARPLEFVGSAWLGVLFLACTTLLAVDVVTLGGLALPSRAPALRGWGLVAACVLSSSRSFRGCGRRRSSTTRSPSPGCPPSATAPCSSRCRTSTSAP